MLNTLGSMFWWVFFWFVTAFVDVHGLCSAANKAHKEKAVTEFTEL